MKATSLNKLRTVSLALILALAFSAFWTAPVGAVINASSFAASVAFTVQNRPIDAAVGDIDGDGKLDLAVANETSTSVSVLRNTSTPGTINAGSFAAAVSYAARTGNTRSVALGDLNADGLPDMAVSNYNGYYVSVWRNTSTSGSISFGIRQDFAASRYNNWVAFSDIDADGKPDMIVSSLTSHGVYIFRNTSAAGGAISFAAAVFFATGNSPWLFGVGDIDGDNLPDLAVCNQGASSVTIMRNTSTPGTISFVLTSIATATAPYAAAIGDLDGDGKADMAVTSGTNVLIFRNTGSTGTITFSVPVTYAMGSADWDVLIGDMDVDGKPDLVFTSGFSVLPNNSTPGTISFGAAVVFGGGTRPGAIGDLDGDGRLDMATPAWPGTTVLVFRNTTPPVVTIDSINPNPTNSGTTVTWHADKNGTYSVRVGGTSCTTGNEAASGTYSTSPGTVNSSVATGLLTVGSNTLRVCVTDSIGNTGSVTGTVTQDLTAPTLNSFARNTPATSPTNADTLIFRATFNEDVFNVDTNDFTASGTTATATLVTPVSASVYDITISGGDLASFSGTVGLNLSGAQNITDLAGNALLAGEPGIDQTYLLDNATPTLSSFTRSTPATTPTNADTLVFRATFDEDVLNVDATDFVVNSITTAAITNVATVNSTTYDITVSGGDLASFNGNVGLDVAGGQDIVDGIGNPLSAAEPGIDQTYLVDNDPPAFTSFTRQNPASSLTNADTLVFRATFDEAVSDVDASDFTVNSITTATITNVASVDAATYDITVSGGDLAAFNGNVGLDLSGAQNIVDLAFNPLPNGEPGTDETYDVENGQPNLDAIALHTPATSPTNVDTLTFRLTFSEDVLNVNEFDFTVNSTTTATITNVATVNASTYDITVSGGDLASFNGTVGLNVAPGQNITDLAGNLLPTAEPATDETYLLDNYEPGLLSFTYQNPAASPTNADTLVFQTSFNEDVQNVDAADFLVNSTTTATITNVAVVDAATYDITVSGGDLADFNGTVGLDLAGTQNISDLGGNVLPGLEPEVDEEYLVDNTFIRVITNGVVGEPGSVIVNDNTGYLQQFTSLVITFNSDANDSGGGTDTDDVTNALNYLLLQPGPNATLDTTSCFAFSDNANVPLGDDIRIPTGPVVYENAQGAGPYTATVTVNNGIPLPVGQYSLLICGTTSITDLAGNHLNGGEDTLLSFRIVSPALPDTGFAPGMISDPGVQPDSKTHIRLTGLWLEVPELNVQMSIVGIPLLEDGWDVSWLGGRAGWLQGTAYPTWDGNSVITGHVWSADNTPGPFLHLNQLRWGDQVIVHAYGMEYIYEVRSLLFISPWNIKPMLLHEKAPWLTLVSCYGFNAKTGEYAYRLLVRAVLVDMR